MDIRSTFKQFLTPHFFIGLLAGAVLMYLLIFYFLIVLGIVFAIVVFGFLFRDKLRDLMANPEATIKKTAKQILTKTSTAESVKKKRGPNKQCPECKRSRGHKPSCSQAQAKKVEI